MMLALQLLVRMHARTQTILQTGKLEDLAYLEVKSGDPPVHSEH